MILNYDAIISNGDSFRFPAQNDVDAKRIILDHLVETGNHKAWIQPWDVESKQYNSDKAFEIEIAEKPIARKREFRLRTEYFRYVRIEGSVTELEFEKATDKICKNMNTLEERSGWEKKFTHHAVDFTDDDRYGADIIVVNI